MEFLADGWESSGPQERLSSAFLPGKPMLGIGCPRRASFKPENGNDESGNFRFFSFHPSSV
jgi:hypothetical protein